MAHGTAEKSLSRLKEKNLSRIVTELPNLEQPAQSNTDECAPIQTIQITTIQPDDIASYNLVFRQIRSLNTDNLKGQRCRKRYVLQGCRPCAFSCDPANTSSAERASSNRFLMPFLRLREIRQVRQETRHPRPRRERKQAEHFGHSEPSADLEELVSTFEALLHLQTCSNILIVPFTDIF